MKAILWNKKTGMVEKLEVETQPYVIIPGTDETSPRRAFEFFGNIDGVDLYIERE